MNRNKILKSLEKGKYKIEALFDCDCNFEWSIDDYVLNVDVEGDCSNTSVLKVGNKVLVEYDSDEEEYTVVCDEIDLDDIKAKIFDEMEDAAYESHYNRKLQTLVNFLKKKAKCDTAVDPDGELALVFRDDDYYTVISPEEWAKRYLEEGEYVIAR